MSKKTFMALPKFEWKAVLINALIAAIGAGLTYISQAISKADFGQFTELIVAAWFLLVKIISKYLNQIRIARAAAKAKKSKAKK